MKIQKVKITEVKRNPDNPRIIKDDKFNKLVNSIKEFPKMLEIRPIVVNEKMIVLGGNMRLKACKEAGLKEVFIIKAEDLTEEQQKEFIVKDNVGFGEWDFEHLANEWDSQKLEEWGLDTPVFEETLEKEEEGNFDDEGVGYKEQYGVIVVCKGEDDQEKAFKVMSDMGYECKIVVT